jgi:hypothetical protein
VEQAARRRLGSGSHHRALRSFTSLTSLRLPPMPPTPPDAPPGPPLWGWPIPWGRGASGTAPGGSIPGGKMIGAPCPAQGWPCIAAVPAGTQLTTVVAQDNTTRYNFVKRGEQTHGTHAHTDFAQLY